MKGIQNLQSNCFINSSIQSLFCIDLFNTAIIDKIKKDINYFKQPLINQYCKLIQQNNDENQQIIHIRQFLKIIYEYKSSYMQQSDANEFLLWFSKKIFKLLETDNLFEGIENYDMIYACKHSVLNKQQLFRTIFIKDTDINKYKDLQSILENKQSETIQNANCEICNSPHKLKITKQIIKLPNIINIQFFKSNSVKLHIEMEMRFKHKSSQSSQLSQLSQLPSVSKLYILKAIIVYQGNSLNGHYVSIVNNSQEWTLCDDSDIYDLSNINPDNQQTCDNYQNNILSYLHSINNQLITLIYEFIPNHNPSIF